MTRALASLLALLLLAGCGGDAKKAQRPTPTPEATAEEEEEPAACTPSPKDSLSVRGRFKPGETRVIEIVKKRIEKGEEQEAATSAKLEVVGARRLRWTSEGVVLAPGTPPEDFVMEYSVDGDGAYQRLENVGEVRAKARRLVVALEKAQGDAVPAEAKRRLRKLLLSDAFLQNALTQDISTLHAIYGSQLKEDEERGVATELPNPFGGSPIPGRARVENAGQDDLGCAQVVVRVTPRPGAIRRLVEEGFSGIAPDGTKYPRNLRLVHIAEYTYDEGSGWMMRVEAIKDMRSGRTKRADHTIMTLKKG